MRAIFISYRREDAEGEAGRLFDDLVSVFGEHSVFMDVAAIEVGRDFRKAIDESVATCGVLLAIIGKGWMDAKDETGQRRLDNSLDFVRLETASALKRDIPVIPVLVHGAKMPRAEQLPDDLKELAYRNGVELTHARWSSDVKLLLKALRPYVGEPGKGAVHGEAVAGAAAARIKLESDVKPIPKTLVGPSPTPPRKPLGLILGAVAAILVAGAAVAYLMMPKQVTVPDLSGNTLAAATSKLQSLKLTVGQTTLKEDATKDPNTVLSQSPAANTSVKGGTAVDLVLSQRPQQAMVEVPSVVGKSLDAARQALDDRQFAVGSVSSQPKSDVAANTVLDQFPRPGKKVEQGSAIDLVVAQAPVAPGRELVKVPKLVGTLLDQARSQLQGQGLYLGKVTTQPRGDIARNTVLSQSASPGQQVQRASRIDLVVSETPKAPATATIPSLTGMSLEQARAELQNQGLSVGNTTQQANASVGANTVLSQSPSPGQQVAKGSRVDLMVSAVKTNQPSQQATTEVGGCAQHIRAGKSYRDWHQGPKLAFAGQININSIYHCAEGTCFSAEMSFDKYGGVDKATGFWSGSHFQLRRFVTAGGNTQLWSGECMQDSVSGKWYIENERSNNGRFSIYY